MELEEFFEKKAKGDPLCQKKDEDIAFIRQTVFDRSTFQDPISYIVPGKRRIDAVSIGAALPFIKDFLSGIGRGGL